MEKIILAQLNPIPGNIEYNKNKVINSIKEACGENVELIIFPSMFLYGYHKKDMLIRFPYLIDQIKDALLEIKDSKFTAKVLISYPEIINNKLSENFVLISNGEINTVKDFVINEIKFEIITEKDFEKSEFKMDSNCLILVENIISRTNSEFNRKNKIKEFIKKQNKKLIYINQVGAQDELIYDGISCFFDENANLLAQACAFKEEKLAVDYYKGGNISNLPAGIENPINLNEFSLNYEGDLDRTYQTIILAIRDYFYKNGFKKAVLGLSGGLDSTVCAVLLADALGKENVLGISMPSKLTSFESKNDAKELADNLGINFIEVAIKEFQDLFGQKFDNIFDEVDKNWQDRSKIAYTQDNIQARSRAMMIWGVANEYAQTLPIATSDKSEFYMGYATVNGDMSGGFAPICDVCKTKLFALARWMNKNREQKNAIPEAIIEKPPGAELAINPKTGKTLLAEEALMPYEFLDEVIYRIENMHQSIKDMMKEEFLYEKKNIVTIEEKQAWLEKFFRRMNAALYKGYIMPPGPIVDICSNNKTEYKQPIVSKIKHY